MESELIGYARKSRNGNALKLSISTTAFEEAQRYSTKNGEEFVGLILNVDHVYQLLEGEKDVTSICQLVD